MHQPQARRKCATLTTPIALLIACALVVLGAGVTRAASADVSGISPVIEDPIVARGGVFLAELDATQHGDNWPTSIKLDFERGTDADAQVIWIDANPRPARLHWTSPTTALRARAITPEINSATDRGRPFLIAEIADDVDGSLRILETTLDPVYMAIPQDPPVSGAPLVRTIRPDRPDPNSPFEYWRWVLLARRLEVPPPSLPNDPIDRLIARYHADLWRIGFARVEAASPGVVDECIRILTRICTENGTPFAAWVTSGDALQRLLGMVLDPTLSGRKLAERTLDWCDSQELLFFWLRRDHGNRIELAMVNPRRDPRGVVFRWMYGDPVLDQQEIPSMVELAPGQLTTVTIDRPQKPSPELEGGASIRDPQLLIRSGTFEQRFNVRPSAVSVEPPGLPLGPFYAGLTLVDAQQFRIRPVSPAYSTTANLRRRAGRWELFFECFRRGGASANVAAGSTHLDPLDDWKDTIGYEAVTLLIGPERSPTHALTVPEVGQYRLWHGSDAAGSLEVEQKSLSDRWWCTIVLPDSWLGYPYEAGTLIGLVRTHRDDQRIETMPHVATPWSIAPGRLNVDLQGWLDLPGGFTPRGKNQGAGR